MINDNTKKEILEKILASNTFKNSQTYQKLLQYLVKASVKNESPKEYDIAIEVFGRDAKFNPAEDPSIRVYISNLRKKLKRYYSEEGKREKIRLDIPPGHYVVVFSTNKASKDNRFFSRQKILYGVIALLAVIVLGFVALYTFSGQPATENEASFLDNPVWAEFSESENELLVVLGDDYFIEDPKKPVAGILRFHQINSDEDLEKLAEEQPRYADYVQTPYTFTPHLSLIPVVKLFPLLCARKKINIENSSRIKTADFLENDLLFLGSFRNIYILRQLLSGLVQDIKLGTGENRLSLSLNDSSETYILEGFPKIKHTDYCLVRKIPGPKNNTIVLFISFFETGMSRTSTYMTDLQTLEELNEVFTRKYGSMPPYFDCLFKVSGLERTGLTIRLEYFARLDPQKLKIW